MEQETMGSGHTTMVNVATPGGLFGELLDLGLFSSIVTLSGFPEYISIQIEEILLHTLMMSQFL
jgi:hypothetical protein